MAGFKPSVLALAGAVVMTAGIAHAQEAATPQERAAVRAEVPWYERFTVSHGPTEAMTGLGPADRASQPAWSLSRRWGVTVDVHQAERTQPDAPPANGDERTVGAYFQFTPSVRVGGAVSVREADRAPISPSEPVEPTAGVRIESAFRF